MYEFARQAIEKNRVGADYVRDNIHSVLKVIEDMPELLADERRKRGLSLRALSRETGIERTALTRYESRSQVPGRDHLVRVLTWIAS